MRFDLINLYHIIATPILGAILICALLGPIWTESEASEDIAQSFRLLCHQIPTRCFWIAGAPMLICARCTGLFLGQLTAVLFRRARIQHLSTAMILLSIMFVSWVGGHFFIPENYHIERLVTGFCGGLGSYTLIAHFLNFCQLGRRNFRGVAWPVR
jgi:uncharacterized membrane protein